jgi:hypothetical protein
MPQPLCDHYDDHPGKNRRRYFSVALIWFIMSVATGTLVALAEHYAWIPSVFSNVFPLPRNVTVIRAVLAFDGVLIGSTIVIPLLFFAGMHPVGYYYVSRVLISSFGFFQGVDVWHYLFALFQNANFKSWMLLLPVVFLISIGVLTLRVHATVARGVRCKEKYDGIRPSIYCSKMIEYWGAMMILRALFYGMYASVC